MIAAAAFLLGILGSLFVAEANLADRLMMAFLPAGMAFIATLMLFARDHWRHAATMRSVRRMLLDRALVDDAEHLAHSPDADPT